MDNSSGLLLHMIMSKKRKQENLYLSLMSECMFRDDDLGSNLVNCTSELEDIYDFEVAFG